MQPAESRARRLRVAGVLESFLVDRGGGGCSPRPAPSQPSHPPRSRSVSTANPSAAGTSPGTNEKILFWASFCTLVAAGIGFSVRGVSILKDWGNQFGFTQTELGT